MTVTNSAGCTGIDIVNVPSATAPTAFFTPTVFGFTVQVADGSTGGGDYCWDFDGNGSTDATTAGTTSHGYLTAGTYTITLIVQNFCGADTFSQTIAIGGVGMENQFAAGATLFPNPARDRVTLELDLTKGGSLTLHLMDNHGRILMTETSVQYPGFFRRVLDIQSLPGGMYHIAVMRGIEVLRRSFVKS